MWTLESQILSALYNDSEALARGRLFVIFPLPRSTLSPKHLAGLVTHILFSQTTKQTSPLRRDVVSRGVSKFIFSTISFFYYSISIISNLVF